MFVDDGLVAGPLSGLGAGHVGRLVVGLGELCCGVVGAGVLEGVVAAGAGGVVGAGLLGLDGVVAAGADSMGGPCTSAGASDMSGPCTSAALVGERCNKKKDGAKISAAISTSGNRLFIHVYL